MLKFLLFLPLVLFASDRHSAIMSALDTDESFDIAGCVSPITGEYYISESDVIVPGVEPIVISRTYLSGGFEAEFEKWSLFPQKLMHRKEDEFGKPHSGYMLAAEPTGSILKYYVDGSLHSESTNRTTNTSRGSISAKTWLNNNRIDIKDKKHPVLIAADGTKRFYSLYKKKKLRRTSTYRLERELKPNGHWVIYEYERENVTRIYTTNHSRDKIFAWVNIKYPFDGEHIRFYLSDGRDITFKKVHIQKNGKDWWTFGTFHFPHREIESLEFDMHRYQNSGLVHKRRFSHGRNFEINYFPAQSNGKVWVHKLAAPVKHDANLHTTKTMDYHPFDYCTDVHDANGLLKRYKYTQAQRPESITLWHGPVQYYSTSFKWDRNGLLLERNNATTSSSTRTHYRYYPDGNIKDEYLRGELTGEGNQDEAYRLEYKYNESKYLREIRHPSDKKERFFYVGETSRLDSKIYMEGDTVIHRTEYHYDADDLLVKEITKDENGGNYHTEKHIEIGQYYRPGIIWEYYVENGVKKLLKKTALTYDRFHNVCKSEHYDATDTYRYTLHFDYDVHGNLLRSTDPLGRETINKYDHFSNLIETKTPDTPILIKNDYDFVNRHIATHGYAPDGTKRHTHYTYDEMSYKVAETDPYENTTYIEPDPLGRPIKITNPLNQTTTATYDYLGNPLTKTDPEDHTTISRYNSRSQVLEQVTPGRGTTKNYYNIDGTLKKTIAPNGLITECSYDGQGRVLSKSTPYHTETFIYDAFNLLSHTHPDGQTTTYTYDGAGRKTSETTSDITTTYTYDPLGRVHKVQTGDKITLTEYDLLNRPILVIETGTDGITHSLEQTEYDTYGRKILTSKKTPAGNALNRYTYDDYGRVIHHINPLGQTTHTEYIEDHRNALDQRVLKKITTNPNGTQTIDIHDVLGRVIQTEKISPFGDSLVTTLITYSPAGRVLQKKTLIPTKSYTLSWDYNEAGDVITLHEETGKTTHYTHDIMGNIISETKPDGTLIETTYDLLGRKTSLTASDIHYTYDYDAQGRIHPSDTYLHYDSRGNILEETLANGLTFQKTYDEYSRLLTLTLPDHTTIHYTYDAYHLISVTYQEHTNHIEYTYHLPTIETLPLDQGHITNTYNLLSQCISQTTPHATHSILALDPNGNILATNTATYTYDPLDQLTSENSTTYTYDGLKNRTSKDSHQYLHDANNQIVATSTGLYTNDQNGNRTSDPTATYTYDALNRLTQINSHTYTYDSFNRCLSSDNTLYLYNGQHEIGAYTDHITQLRILTNTPFAEIGSARLILLDNVPYVPYHDLQGNLIHLQESTTFTAFGEGAPIAPWGYQSKRHHAHLINFGRRHYDPHTGTWLSPDPKGFADHLNLYQYLHNNPLLAHDPFGLLTMKPYPTHAEVNRTRQELLFATKTLNNVLKLSNRKLTLAQGEKGLIHLYPKRHPSSIMDITKQKTPKGAIIFGNGIDVKKSLARDYSKHFAKMIGNANVDYSWLHTSTNGTAYNVLDSLISMNLGVLAPSRLLTSRILDLHKTLPKEAPIMLVLHSRGAIEGLNTGLSLPKSARDRLNVVTVAGAAPYPDQLAHRARNYRAYFGSDFVGDVHKYGGITFTDATYSMRYLRAKPGAKALDHGLLSPTYDKELRKEVGKFLGSIGEVP